MAAYDDLAALSNLQKSEAQFFGNEASKVADPYGYQRRNAAADKFDTLLSNPGAMNTSPFYKYLRNTAMRATRAGNAAGGFRNSGRGQLALQNAASGAATKAFFPLAELYGKASGALNPLSPAAAALSLSGAERGMDYAQLEAAARGLAARQPTASADSTPWWMRDSTYDFSTTGAGSAGGTGLPTGGTNYYTPGQLAYAGYPTGKDPRMMTNAELDRAAGNTMLADFQPTYGASDPAAMAEQNYWGYE